MKPDDKTLAIKTDQNQEEERNKVKEESNVPPLDEPQPSTSSSFHISPELIDSSVKDALFEVSLNAHKLLSLHNLCLF